METRILQEEELGNAAGLSRFVFDSCLRNRMEYPQTVSFVEEYLQLNNLEQLVQSGKVILWGTFVQEQLVGVAGLQSDGMITMLYVLPQFWNRGIGGELLSTMRTYAKEQYGMEKVLLNATPAWTAGYFLKQGFDYMGGSLNMRAPFVSMQAWSSGISLITKRRIPKKYIILAIVGCFLLATIATVLFMNWYLK